ncbi:hypothetical protein EDD66_103136 [Mobilisporobacter senegalensis]|uniref:Uncharacterized protein n=1 Tax=Mobilisporobacter senegalensis TaxID=1329262 RepID=A0A3N1XSS7_9FIRM|nr:hypothetical protein [Mobilisporobacter senegalensis]ROR29201.1 hypothetical protein EDD66_103136 [Mobilisporobacter senegalensis]
MINKILFEYKNAFSFKNKYLKYFKKRSVIISFAIVVLGFTVLTFLSYILEMSWPLIFLCIPIFFIMPILNIEIKRIVKEQYDCKNKYEVNKLFKLDFEKRLRQKYIDVLNIEQIDYLIPLIDQNLAELKPSLYIKSGIFAGIFGPLWLSYVTTIFKYTKSIDEATKVFVIIIVLFAMIYGLYFGFKEGIIKDILYSDYNKMKELRNLMIEYRLINMNEKSKITPTIKI